MAPGINRRYVVFAVTILGLFWLWVLFDRPTSLSPPRIWNIVSNEHIPKLVDPNLDILDFPPLESWVIRDVCETTEWNSSLIFTCDNNHGGVGHVRNSILNCVRYAISAGASLVLPNIALREDEDWNMMEPDHDYKLKRHGPGRKGIDYMFDKPHFIHSLRQSCPELILIPEMEQTSGGRRRALLPESLESNHPTTGLEQPFQWCGRFYDWVDIMIPHYPQNLPIVVDLEQSFLSYPTYTDGHLFAHQFGRILKFRPDVRRLATKTLKQLSRYYDLNLNLCASIIPNSFLAIHLRTNNPLEEEVLGIGKRHGDIAYAHYEAQARIYLATAQALNLSLIYIASGNLSDIRRLTTESAARGLQITHKEDLLKGDDREELENLRWDQRALVDFLVVTKAQQFLGVGHSSFPWNVAVQRHEFATGKGRLEGEQPDGVWGDGISGLFGVRRGYVDSSGCMWP